MVKRTKCREMFAEERYVNLIQLTGTCSLSTHASDETHTYTHVVS